MRVLISEDDKLLADGLRRVLETAMFAVDVVQTGEDADKLLRTGAYDLVVLDVGLPGIDGFEVLRRLRARGDPVRVLMLTARDEVKDRVHGLDLGADDYLTKPFSVTEFEARARALVRRSEPTNATAIIAGKMQIDFAAKRIKVRNVAIDLTVREWALLQLFLAFPGRVLSKEQIIQELFAVDEHASPNTVEVYVSRLRAKIEPSGVKVRTVRGFGYLWDAEPD